MVHGTDMPPGNKQNPPSLLHRQGEVGLEATQLTEGEQEGLASSKVVTYASENTLNENPVMPFSVSRVTWSPGMHSQCTLSAAK